MPLDVALAFCATSLVLALAPGPDNLFVLTQSAMNGVRTGLVLTLGLCSGLIAHSIAAAFGVSALFRASPAAFLALKAVGVTYLLYLAWRAFRARPKAGSDQTPTLDVQRAYRTGVIMNLSNPKVAIFFLAFLPQFASPARGDVALQLLALGGLFILCSLVAFSALAICAGFISPWLRRSRRARLVLDRAAALVFVGLAVNLAFVSLH